MMRTKAFYLAGILLMWGSTAGISQAQTTNITPSGLGTTLNGGALSCAGNCTITGGTRAGTNLFHSFGLFNVGAGDTANFFNNTGLPTKNILSRVTGGSASNIFGAIQTTGFGNANFFLINPAGVVFGPNASLDIGVSMGTPGSFHVSTADYLKMADGKLFIANPSYENSVNRDGSINTTVLSSAAPQAFGFLSANPAPITFDNSFLSVGAGQTLSVVGGDITMTGGALNAPGGQINLVSVASAGEILLPGMQSAPNVNGDSFASYGTINMSQGATLDVSDYGFEVDGRAGTVLIRGGQLVMDSAYLFAFTIGDTDGATTGINIDMAGDVQLSNLSLVNTDTFGLGRAGDIVVNARNLDIRDLSFINTHSGGGGPAGNVSITASGAVTLTGTDGFGNFSNISSVADSGGDSGTVAVHAASITLDQGAQIRTQSAGHAGGVTLDASGDVNILHGSLVEIDSSGGGSSGAINITGGGTVTISGQLDPFTPTIIFNASDSAPANISINAGSFLLTDGARINARTSTGTNGSIAIAASESATVAGGSEIINAMFSANGGSLALSAPSITIDNALLSTRANGTGNAGTLTISAGNLTVSGGSVVASTTFSSGHGGPLSIAASGAILLSGGSSIESRSTGTGNAGNIQVTANDSLVLQGHSSISTATTMSDGGNINIQAGRLVQLTDSQITTSVQGGLGNGGNITIDPQFTILQASQILAQAFGGNGGNIRIVTGVLLVDPASTISASSTFGVSGTVNVQATVTNLNETVTPLSGEFVHTPELLQARCAARFQGGQYSSFVVAGRDGLPLEPGGLLPSPLFVERQGSPRLAKALDVPGLRSARALGETSLALAPLETGCAS